MPKPVITLPEWASGAAYVAPGKPWDGTARRDSTGLAGSAGDGFTPETPSADPPAENENEWLHRVWEWIDTWVRQGSFLADLDDHIVETDTLGDSAIARLVLGGTANAGQPLTVISNAAGAAASFSDTVGNFAATATTSGALAALRGTNTGTGAGLEGRSVGSTGPGVLGDAGSGGNAGVEGDGGTGGHGVQGTSGSVGGFGVRGISINGSPAVQGEGNVANASSEGVQGVAAHPDAHGVRGFTAALGTTLADAVRGDGRGDGTGVHGEAEDGYGVIAESDTTTPQRAALRVVPQDADPITQLQGDVAFNSAENHLKVRELAGWHGIWSTPSGIVHGFDSDAGVVDALAAELPLAILTINPKGTGDVIVTGEANYGSDAAGVLIQFQLRDGNGIGGPIIGTRVVEATGTGAADSGTMFIRESFTLPTALPRDMTLTARRVGGAGTWRVGKNSIEATGAF